MIALLSNITVGPFLVNTLEKLTNKKIYKAPGYNTWAQDLLREDLPEGLDACFLLLDGSELLGEKGLTNSSAAKKTLTDYLAIIDRFVELHPQVPLFVSSLDIAQRRLLPVDFPRVELFAMALWRQELGARGLYCFELAELAATFGRERFYSQSLWYLGSMPFSMHGEKAIAAEMERCWRALQGKRKKCLVLDLDNTLWGGVIGEDGVGGIVLGTAKEGAKYYDFQKRILDLKKEGIILAVVSKNNPEDALAAIREHADMVLREKDFVVIKANWQPKAFNIEVLAKELNLGLDSFVFIDDNPVERATVKTALPMVTVPEFPQDTNKLEQFIIEVSREYFPVLRLTQEDIRKSEQYREEQQRVEIKKKFTNIEDFLKSLEMRFEFHLVGDNDVARVAQLTQKTNQFNLRTIRYTEADIRQMLNSPDWYLWIGELGDKFGEYGKIILCFAHKNGETAFIDTFLMSCRVMGRMVEKCFLHLVENALLDVSVSTIQSEYLPSAKNSVVGDFWINHGYTRDENSSDKKFFYYKQLPSSLCAPEYITVVRS